VVQPKPKQRDQVSPTPFLSLPGGLTCGLWLESLASATAIQGGIPWHGRYLSAQPNTAPGCRGVLHARVDARRRVRAIRCGVTPMPTIVSNASDAEKRRDKTNTSSVKRGARRVRRTHVEHRFTITTGEAWERPGLREVLERRRAARSEGDSVTATGQRMPTPGSTRARERRLSETSRRIERARFIVQPRRSNRFNASTPTLRRPCRRSASAEAASATSVSGGNRSSMNL
jgi:hypothetical protein